MENDGKLGMVIVVFLLIILGAVFLEVLSDHNWLHRNTYTVANGTETLSTVSNSSTTQMAHYPVASILFVVNATGGEVVAATNYSATTSSVYYMYNGLFLLSPDGGGFSGEDVNISYTYYPSGYVRASNARIILNLVPLFFVIAILLFVVMPVMKKFELI